MPSKFTFSSAIAAVAITTVLIAMPVARSQNSTGVAPEIGSETANWGLAPFSAIPTITLRPEDRAAIRALEDRHIKERRTFEDKYEMELRQLIRKQAEERDALRARLTSTR